MVNKADRREELDKVRQDIIDNNVCPDLAANATNLVMGDGNVDADIVFVGEAPGRKEDEQALPFVGASGKLLDKMLLGVGMSRDDVYITNILKYRPPDNRDPLPEEKDAFWPYLLEQLQIIQPKIVITLGRHSMEYFLPGMKISQIHGQLMHVRIDDKNIVLVPLYHPAAALYNGSMRQTLVDDFTKTLSAVKKL